MENLDLFECKKFRSVYLAAETETEYTGEPILTPEIAAEFIRPFYGKTIQTIEKVYLLCLSTSKRPVTVAQVSVGSISAAIVEPRIVAKIAIDSLAKSVILFHNHPSGSLLASDSDLRLTEKVKKTLDIFQCDLDDHIIITENGHSSLRGLCKL